MCTVSRLTLRRIGMRGPSFGAPPITIHAIVALVSRSQSDECSVDGERTTKLSGFISAGNCGKEFRKCANGAFATNGRAPPRPASETQKMIAKI